MNPENSAWYTIVQNQGFGFTVLALIIIGMVLMFRYVMFPLLKVWGKIREAKMEIELENWKKREEQDLEQQRVSIESMEAQKQIFSGVGDVLAHHDTKLELSNKMQETQNKTMQEILAQLSTLSKKQAENNHHTEAIRTFISETLETEAVKSTLPSLKKAMLVVLKNLKRKGEITEEEYATCSEMLKK